MSEKLFALCREVGPQRNLKRRAGHGPGWRTKRKPGIYEMNMLTAFGLFAVTAMLVCYGLEKHSHWFILAFAASCVLGSIYGFLQGAWPFGLMESIWSLVAVRRWWTEKNLKRPDALL